MIILPQLPEIKREIAKQSEFYVMYNKVYNNPHTLNISSDNEDYIGTCISDNEASLNNYITFYNKWADFYTEIVQNKYTKEKIDSQTLKVLIADHQELEVRKKTIFDIVKDLNREILMDLKIYLTVDKPFKKNILYGTYIFYSNPHISKRELTINNYKDALATFISSDNISFYKDLKILHDMRSMRKKYDKQNLTKKFKTK